MQFTEWTTNNSELVKYWSFKNKLNPNQVSKYSDKKVWWFCDNGHEWQAVVYHRIKGVGCPYCSGRFATKDNNLATLYPKLAKEYSDKNKIVLDTLKPMSNKKVWWKCDKEHEWQASVCNRVKNKTGCPYCKGKKATKENCLYTLHPEISKEWSFKNKITPNNVLSKSHKKVWWNCPNGHEYFTSIASRTNCNSGCPICAWQTSKLEIRIYCELKCLTEAVWRDRSHGCEIDVYLPKEKIGIEIDGWYWHKDKLENDVQKNKHLKNKGITLIRMRGIPLNLIEKNDILFEKTYNEYELVHKLIKKINQISNKNINYPKEKWNNNEEFIKLISHKNFKEIVSENLDNV